MHRITLAFVVLGSINSVCAFMPPPRWAASPSGLQPELHQVHVESMALKTQGTNTTSYNVDAWYFDSEIVVRIRSGKSNMIGYEDKKKSQASYWEKGIDASTPYFPKEWLDGIFTDLVPHADIWFYQEPIRNIVKPTGSYKETSPLSSATTVTLKIPIRGGEPVLYYSASYENHHIVSATTSVDSNGVIEDEIVTTRYSIYDQVTSLPLHIVHSKKIAPYELITHKVSKIEKIPSSLTPQKLLDDLVRGYRPITIARLKDPRDRMGGRVALNWQYVAVRILGAAGIISLLAYSIRYASRGRK